MGKSLDLDAASGLEPAPPGTVRVGLVATFARWKGHQVFLEALARLSSRTPVRGYIIGAPIYQTGGSQWSLEELRRQANRLGLEGRVGFTGFVDDVSGAMRSLDIVVHASTQPEPFGMVIIEAMACARPIVASRAGGAAELITEGDNALSHPPGDSTALAELIMLLACNQELRERMGKAGRTTAERLFGRDRLAGELISLYRQICGTAGAAAFVSKPSERVEHGC